MWVLASAFALQLATSAAVSYLPRFRTGTYPSSETFPRFNPAGIDFAVVYVAARRVTLGQDPYWNYPDDLTLLGVGKRGVPAGPAWRNLYGPATALLFLPLAGLAFPTAYSVFSVVSLVALAASLAVFARGLGLGGPATWIVAAMGGALTIGSYPLDFLLERGNWYSLIQLGIALACAWEAGGRGFLAGAAVGVCTGLKVSPGGLALAWLTAPRAMSRSWSGFVLASAATALSLGPARLKEWISILLEHGAVAGVWNCNHSFTVFTLLFNAPHWWPRFIGYTAIVICWICLVQRGALHQHADRALRAAAFLAPLPLLTVLAPISNDYNLPLQVLPYLAALVLVARIAAGRRGPRATVAAVLAGALVVAAGLLLGPPIDAEGRWKLFLWQKTLQVMTLQVLVLLAVTLALTRSYLPLLPRSGRQGRPPL